MQMLQERLRETENTLERERQQFRLAQEAQMAAGRWLTALKALIFILYTIWFYHIISYTGYYIHILHTIYYILHNIYRGVARRFLASLPLLGTAGADLRQLEENSRTVLLDCQQLQQKVKELELERSVFLEVQAKSEEERRALVARLRQLEEEKGRDIEGALQAHREQWREAANCDMQQMSGARGFRIGGFKSNRTYPMGAFEASVLDGHPQQAPQGRCFADGSLLIGCLQWTHSGCSTRKHVYIL